MATAEPREKVQIMGTDGTTPLDIAVCVSGELLICSGLHVVADIAESGMGVLISGQHVYVESGVHVVADIAESGMGVLISGQHVYVESGVHVVADIAESGMGVLISGQPVTISGDHVYIESGAYVQIISGAPLMITDLSGDIADVLSKHEALVTAGYSVSEVHKGDMYRANCCWSGVASGSCAGMIITPASGMEIHTQFEASLGGGGEVRVFEGVLIDAATSGCQSGTCPMGVCTPQNLNRYISATCDTTICCWLSGFIVASGQVLSGQSDLVWCDVVPGRARGGNIRTDTSWILNGAIIVSGVPMNYLYCAMNKGGDPKDICLAIEFTEETP